MKNRCRTTPKTQAVKMTGDEPHGQDSSQAEEDNQNGAVEVQQTHNQHINLVDILAKMEQNRLQAELNQMKMMEQQAQILEQIAMTRSTSEYATHHGGTQITSKWSDFRKTKPPIFLSSPDPIEADDWIRDVERRLNTVQCTDKEKTLYASHQLQGPAATWWMNYQTMRGNQEISWEEFKESFHQTHVPTGVVEAKRREFLALKQGRRTVMEYLHQFNHLARYAPDDVKNETKKMEQFKERLQ